MRGLTPLALLADRLRRDPASPLITFYDDSTGERTELSATSFDNWVAKAANLLAEECELGPGDTVALALPAHWQTLVMIMAAWRTGIAVDLTGRRPAAAFIFSGDDLALSRPPVPQLLALSLRPLGAGLQRAEPGVLDLARELPGYADQCALPPPDPDAPALVDEAGEHTLAELTARAQAAALPAGSRLLVTGPERVAGVDRVLAVLAAGGSLVLCRRADPDLLAARTATERATAG